LPKLGQNNEIYIEQKQTWKAEQIQ
jgi:hypothetical protein